MKNNLLEFSGDLATQDPSKGGVAFLGNIMITCKNGTVITEGNELKVKGASH